MCEEEHMSLGVAIGITVLNLDLIKPFPVLRHLALFFIQKISTSP